MPLKQHPTVWEADPHTIAKVTILENYLVAWFQVFGRDRFPRTILYVDGFAGPGCYTNFATGSPIAAVRALLKAKNAEQFRAWSSPMVHCVFVEKDRQRFQHLEQLLEVFVNERGLTIHLFNGEFKDVLPEIRNRFGASFYRHNPLMSFLDPFGAGDVPFSCVEELLSSEQSEVLLYLDADGIARNLKAGNDSYMDKVPVGREWKQTLKLSGTFADLCREVLTIYRNRLTGDGLAKYTFPFEMRSHDNTLSYFCFSPAVTRLDFRK